MNPLIPLILLSFSWIVRGDGFEIPLKREGNEADGVLNNLKVKYLAKIAVGTPPQNINAIFNTGTASVFVPVKSCNAGEDCGENSNSFDPTKSTTFRNTTRFFHAPHDEFTLSGYIFKDNLSLLSNSKKSLTFQRTVSIGGSTHPSTNTDAVFGLPSQVFSQSNENSYNTILHQPLKDSSVNTTYFTLYTSGCSFEGCGNRALLTFGGLDSKNCEKETNFVELIEASPIWEFNTNGISVHTIIDVRLYKTRVDMGSAYISVPSDLLYEYARRWKAITLSQRGTYGVRCSTDLNFGVRIGGKIYKIPNENLLVPLSKEGQDKYGGHICQIAMKSSESINSIELGEPFLRSYCVVHDMSSRTIGFASKIKEYESFEDDEDESSSSEEEDSTAGTTPEGDGEDFSQSTDGTTGSDVTSTPEDNDVIDGQTVTQDGSKHSTQLPSTPDGHKKRKDKKKRRKNSRKHHRHHRHHHKDHCNGTETAV